MPHPRSFTFCIALLWAWTLPAFAGIAFDAPSAEAWLGERLFNDPRFAQYFAANMVAVNQPLPQGDPVLAQTLTLGKPLPGAFADQSISCRSCHALNDYADSQGPLAFNDFARRSPIPERGDGQQLTLRNSQGLLNVNYPRDIPALFHYDAEFFTMEQVVVDTLLGRNLGWLPEEHNAALTHIVQVLREDNGYNPQGTPFQHSYRTLLESTSPALADEEKLTPQIRVDFDKATDQQILFAAARSMAIFIKGLSLATDRNGHFTESAYDRFLAANGLPAGPAADESDRDYARQLRSKLAQLTEPQFIEQARFGFGPQALQGLKVFLREPDTDTKATAASGVGNCIACHAPPAFADYSFHNTGVTQAEYDRVHGLGRFQTLAIDDRTAEGEYLTTRAIPTKADPALLDLGVWNMIGNTEFPFVQRQLSKHFCSEAETDAGHCTLALKKQRAFAAFKTPSLRMLAYSSPYFHDGSADDLNAALTFYQDQAQQAREGALRQAAPQLADIRLNPNDIQALRAFLNSLNTPTVAPVWQARQSADQVDLSQPDTTHHARE